MSERLTRIIEQTAAHLRAVGLNCTVTGSLYRCALRVEGIDFYFYDGETASGQWRCQFGRRNLRKRDIEQLPTTLMTRVRIELEYRAQRETRAEREKQARRLSHDDVTVSPNDSGFVVHYAVRSDAEAAACIDRLRDLRDREVERKAMLLSVIEGSAHALIYADWLEENGFELDAEVIRTLCQTHS